MPRVKAEAVLRPFFLCQNAGRPRNLIARRQALRPELSERCRNEYTTKQLSRANADTEGSETAVAIAAEKGCPHLSQSVSAYGPGRFGTAKGVAPVVDAVPAWIRNVSPGAKVCWLKLKLRVNSRPVNGDTGIPVAMYPKGCITEW